MEAREDWRGGRRCDPVEVAIDGQIANEVDGVDKCEAGGRYESSWKDDGSDDEGGCHSGKMNGEVALRARSRSANAHSQGWRQLTKFPARASSTIAMSFVKRFVILP